MEDLIAIELQTKGRGQAFVAVFDGHGGKEAAQFADKELWPAIRSMEGFNTTDSEAVRKAIFQGFQNTHDKMWSVRSSWKNSKAGTLSTSGTTASVAIIRRDRMYVANVGDSTVVLGVDPAFADDESTDRASTSSSSDERGQIRAVALTDDHKPESERETRRIERIGGRVLKSSKGVMRVAWLRKRACNTFSRLHPNRSYDVVPFLSVARSLGDLWSYTEEYNDYFVSPVPDISEYKLDVRRDKFVILASDGLWNVMSHKEVVEFVHKFRTKELKKNPLVRSSKVAHALIEEALKKWNKKCWSADNISVMIVFFKGAIKQNSSSQEEEPGTSLRSARMPSSDSGLQSGSESPDSKPDLDDPDSPPYKPLPRKTIYEEMRDSADGLIDMDCDITTTECIETSAPLLPPCCFEDFEIVNHSTCKDHEGVNTDGNDVGIAHAIDGMESNEEDNERIVKKGKRKSTEMSNGHSCPIAVPCVPKRSRSVEPLPLNIEV